MASLVVLRHGQSVWNKIPTFTGWCDVEMTMQGLAEAQAAGNLLARRGYVFDVAFTSNLKRAIRTCEMALQVLDPQVPIVRATQLNERHYGALQGRAKRDPQLIREFGAEQMIAWRREFHATPPPMQENHPYYEPPPAPLTESLADCQKRVLHYWHEIIIPEMREGKDQVLLVAHSNTLRGLVAYLDAVPPTQIPHIHIPNSVPCVYQIDVDTGKAILSHDKQSPSPQHNGSRGHWLLDTENQHRLAKKLGASSESFARSVFDAWDADRSGVLSKEELAAGLFSWKNTTDQALSALSGKLLEELNKGFLDTPVTIESFKKLTVTGCRKHNLPFFAEETTAVA